jgi:hypothetical protein
MHAHARWRLRAVTVMRCGGKTDVLSHGGVNRLMKVGKMNHSNTCPAATSGGESHQSAPLVVFLAGAGRSGSTLLGDAIAQMPSCVHVGELRFLLEDVAWHDRTCGCGQSLRDCPMWRDVRSVAFGSDEVDLEEVMRFSLRALRYRPRALVGLSRQARSAEPIDQSARRYADALRQLYLAVASVTDSQVIVDSSKIAMHVYLGSRFAGVRSHVVHLVRDVRAIAYSWRRSSIDGVTFGPARASGSWVVSNLAVGALQARLGASGYTLVRYEDFIRNPGDILGSIANAIGLPGVPLPLVGASTITVGLNHTVAGNPSRFKNGDVELVPDEEWRRRIGAGDRVLATLPGSVLLRRYGYPLFSG